MRIALYWAPDRSSPLGKAAADWLKGGNVNVPSVKKEEVQSLLSIPNHYGFHATVKPPFTLRSGYRLEDVEREVALFTTEQQNMPFCLPCLEVAQIGKFFCLRPTHESGQLQRLCAVILRRFDHFRKPADYDEIARRRASGLTARQDQLLLEWGYPYVLDEFRFHLTLTSNVQNPNHFKPLKQELLKRFTPALQLPCRLDSLSMFVQHGAQPFFECCRWNFEK